MRKKIIAVSLLLLVLAPQVFGVVNRDLEFSVIEVPDSMTLTLEYRDGTFVFKDTVFDRNYWDTTFAIESDSIVKARVRVWYAGSSLSGTWSTNLDGRPGGTPITAVDVYAEFTTGSNEDPFKATGFATHSAANVLSQFLAGSNEDAFKADVSSLALQSSLLGLITSMADAIDSLALLLDSIRSQASWAAESADLFDPTSQYVTITPANSEGDTITRLEDSTSLQGPAGNLSYSGFDSTAAANPEHFYGPSNSPGETDYVVTYLAYDTVANSPVEGILVNFRNWALNNKLGSALTDENGLAVFPTNYDSVAAIVSSDHLLKFPTVWDSMAYIADHIDTALGYSYVKATPADPSLAAISGSVYGVQGGLPEQGVIVTASLIRKLNVTTASPGFVLGRTVAYDTTDANGQFSMDVIRSPQLADSLKNLYRIIGYADKISTKNILFKIDKVFIPDTGNVDITDIINSRI